MNKLFFIFTLLFTILLLNLLPAQDIYVGGIGGINFADMHIDGEEVGDVTTQSVLIIGGVIGFPLIANTFIQLEPKYMQKGGIVELQNEDFDIELTSGYLEIPVLIRHELANNRFHVLAGPTLCMILFSEMKSEYSSLTFTADSKEVMKTFDFGMTVGAGVSMPFLIGSLFLDGRYSYGLSNIMDGGTVEFKSGNVTLPMTLEEDDDTFNKGLQLMLGFTVPLGR